MEKIPKKRPNNLKSERRVIFNSRTFNSKLFLKLTGHFIHPSIVCVQTLRYERENRKLSEIEKALPWLKTFPDLMNFINLKETNESSHKLLIELTWLLFYRYYKKDIIFKKPGEKGEFVFILLKGKMLKLDLVFKREFLTVEEYLIYLMKMKLSREKEIIKRCRRLNSFYADIDGDNLIKFCKENPQFNYDKLKDIAKKEILELGFKLEDFQEGKKEKIIQSIDNYIKIADVKKNIKNINNILATPKFYIGYYRKVGYITKGMLLGNFTRDYSIDNSTYITLDNCDIVYLNKKISKIKKLYELMEEKKARILSELKNSFLIFKNISENGFLNDVIPYFQYKLFHKGDKIFAQNSFNEGLYFIRSGKLNLYLTCSIIEISTYISNIKNTLKNLENLISNMTSYPAQPPLETEMVKSKSLISAGNIHLFTSKKFDILTINEFSFFGTSELYNPKTDLYYFSAECITKEAVIYFLPKKYFYSLLIKEHPVYVAVTEIIQTKVKFIIERLKFIIKMNEMNRLKDKDNINKEENKNKNFNIFNHYKTSNKILKRNNMNYNGLETFTKDDEKTYDFPILLKDKFFFKNMNKFNEEINDINKERNKSLRERIMHNTYQKLMAKTTSNFYSHKKKYINKKNRTFTEKLFFQKTKTAFQSNIKLKLPSNFPFNIQDEFPTIIKNKNYNIKYLNTGI